MTMQRPNHRDELVVLTMIGGGMILTVILVIIGIFGWLDTKASAPLPNWAENVLVSIISIFAVKIGDVLAALVTLATGRQTEKMTDQLANAGPPIAPLPQAPANAVEAAQDTADAAQAKADKIAQAEGPKPEGDGT